ncbi:MAG: MipA/OmpV family protein [Pseudomonadota bacterium]
MAQGNRHISAYKYHPTAATRRRFFCNSFLLLCAITPALTYAQHRPLWEFGLGAAGLRIPAYRGSNTIDYYGAPFPYFIYRGEKIRIDDEGVSGRVFNLNNVRLDISLGGNVPVRREKNGLRVGMPGLAPVVELGPTLNIRLNEQLRGRYLGLHMPLRPVLSTGYNRFLPDLRYQGWIFAPHLEWQSVHQTGIGLFGARTTAGILYGDTQYHEYFYSVDAAYATAARPEYQARSGYSGTRLTSTLSYYTTSNLSLSLYVRYDELSGATFEHSPLLANRHYFLVALSGIWVFWRSDQRVEHL